MYRLLKDEEENKPKIEYRFLSKEENLLYARIADINYCSIFVYVDGKPLAALSGGVPENIIRRIIKGEGVEIKGEVKCQVRR